MVTYFAEWADPNEEAKEETCAAHSQFAATMPLRYPVFGTSDWGGETVQVYDKEEVGIRHRFSHPSLQKSIM